MKLIRRALSPFLFSLALFLGGNTSGQDDVLRGFVSVEPFEMRLEALLKVSAYREIWRISETEVTASNRQTILDNVGKLLESEVEIQVEGNPLSYVRRELRFVIRDPELGYVTDDREAIPLEDALIGVTLSASAEAVDSFAGAWLWFPPGQERVTIEISSRGRPSARYVTVESPSFDWKQEDAMEMPKLLSIPLVEESRERPLWFLTYFAIGFGLIAVGTILVKKQESPAWVGTFVVGAVVFALFGFTIKKTEVAIPEDEEMKEITFRILRNIYHAFDFRDESSVYDTLEKSVTGPLLEQVYLEIQSSLELESSGGPRVKVHEVALREAVPVDKEEEGVGRTMTVRANWATVGDVSHWGHTHERVNRYEADMIIAPVGDQWKLMRLNLKNEERVQTVSRNQMEAEPIPVPREDQGTTDADSTTEAP